MYARIIFIILVIFILACKSDKDGNDQTETAHIPRITYQIPDGWIEEKPKHAMRKAQFRLPGINDSGDAEMTVFVFPGSGGTIETNLNRWYRQFRQPDGSNSAEKAELTRITVNNLQVTLIFLRGTYLKSLVPMTDGDEKEVPNSALMAAIVETNSAPWFFKAIGPEETIEHWQPSFDQFIQSLVYK